jgi:hypothetical protein
MVEEFGVPGSLGKGLQPQAVDATYAKARSIDFVCTCKTSRLLLVNECYQNTKRYLTYRPSRGSRVRSYT